MTRPSDAPPPPAITPGKLATIVGLGLVLVIVLVVQFSGGEEAPALVKRRLPRTAAVAVAAADPAASSPGRAAHRPWPDLDRSAVAAFDPFEVPAALRPATSGSSRTAASTGPIQIAQAAGNPSGVSTGTITGPTAPNPDDVQARIRATERKSRLERIRATASQLQQQRVGVVVSTSTGAVARIGEQEVRVGDVINGVLQIVEIGPQGIVVEEAREDGSAGPLESP
jgi:hypothetical protein